MTNVHQPGTTAGKAAVLILHEVAGSADESYSLIGQWFVLTYFSQWWKQSCVYDLRMGEGWGDVSEQGFFVLPCILS